jgi:indolepyruvate ferredoxin oxidoreductase, beta subunit
LISRMIGRILSRKGYYLAIGETFGAAQRGGAVHSSMRISRKRTYGPLIPQGRAHVVLSLEPLETLRILSLYGNEHVLTVSNTEPVYPVGVRAGRARYPDIEELKETISGLSETAWFLNASEAAERLGAPIVSNIILFGGLLGINRMPLTVEEVEREIETTFPGSKVDLNLNALHRGIESVQMSA